MNVRSLGYRTDLMVRERSGSRITEDDGCLVVRTPADPSYHWGNFLLLPSSPSGRGLSSWIDRFSALFPEADHIALGIDGTVALGMDESELAEAGLAVDADTVLTAHRLRRPEPPEGRPSTVHLGSEMDWDEALALRQRVSDSEGTTSPSHRIFLEREIARARARALVREGHATYFGARVDGCLRSILGIVSGPVGVARYQTVETDPEYRRRGYASQLVHAAGIHALDRRKTNTLVIVADPSGPAISLYRSLGFAGTEVQTGLTRKPPLDSAG